MEERQDYNLSNILSRLLLLVCVMDAVLGGCCLNLLISKVPHREPMRLSKLPSADGGRLGCLAELPVCQWHWCSILLSLQDEHGKMFLYRFRV